MTEYPIARELVKVDETTSTKTLQEILSYLELLAPRPGAYPKWSTVNWIYPDASIYVALMLGYKRDLARGRVIAAFLVAVFFLNVYFVFFGSAGFPFNSINIGAALFVLWPLWRMQDSLGLCREQIRRTSAKLRITLEDWF